MPSTDGAKPCRAMIDRSSTMSRRASLAVEPEHQVAARRKSRSVRHRRPARRIGHVMQHADAGDDVELRRRARPGRGCRRGRNSMLRDAELVRLPARVGEARAAEIDRGHARAAGSGRVLDRVSAGAAAGDQDARCVGRRRERRRERSYLAQDLRRIRHRLVPADAQPPRVRVLLVLRLHRERRRVPYLAELLQAGGDAGFDRGLDELRRHQRRQTR